MLAGASHLEPCPAHVQVDRGFCIGIRLIGIPDPVHGPGRFEEPQGRIQPKDQVGRVALGNRVQRRRRERRRLRRMRRDIQQPFEPRHIGQIDELAAGWKPGQEVGEPVAVGKEAGLFRRIAADEFVGGVDEESLIDEPADHRKGILQHLLQRHEDVVAVDVQPGVRRQSVLADQAAQCGRSAAEERLAELGLQLTQRVHRAASRSSDWA